jgi:hypothetical protein
MTLVLVAQAFLAAVRAQAATAAGWARGAAERAELPGLPQPPGSDLIRISTAEARRLLVGLVWWTPPTVRQALWWSWWGGRPQGPACRCHWCRRTQRLAAALVA